MRKSFQPQHPSQSLLDPPEPIPTRRLFKLPHHVIVVSGIASWVAELLRQRVLFAVAIVEQRCERTDGRLGDGRRRETALEVVLY
jgi:hypothetical protein